MGNKTNDRADMKCPYCSSNTEDYKCLECGAVLTIQSAEALLGEVERKTDLIREAIQGILAKRSEESDNFDSVFNLALGYLNVRDLDRGALFLAEAGKIHADDKELNGQIDRFLAAIGHAPVEVKPGREAYHQCNILLVDDSATLRMLISAGLSTAGHQVRCAIHGRDALNQLAEFSADVVISDINMPHLDGYELCREIRSNPATRELPVIMLSARDGMFDRELGTSAGATDFIAKPFEIASLLNLVEHYSPAKRTMEVAG